MLFQDMNTIECAQIRRCRLRLIDVAVAVLCDVVGLILQLSNGGSEILRSSVS